MFIIAKTILQITPLRISIAPETTKLLIKLLTQPTAYIYENKYQTFGTIDISCCYLIFIVYFFDNLTDFRDYINGNSISCQLVKPAVGYNSFCSFSYSALSFIYV